MYHIAVAQAWRAGVTIQRMVAQMAAVENRFAGHFAHRGPAGGPVWGGGRKALSWPSWQRGRKKGENGPNGPIVPRRRGRMPRPGEITAETCGME